MSVTWSSYWETQPTGSGSPTLGDDKLRELKQAVRERLEQAHYVSYGTSGALSNDGWHLEGSARVFVMSSAPTVLGDVASTGLSTAVGGVDLYHGRLWFDANNNYLPYIADNATNGFVGFERELVRISIQGTLTTGDDVIPALLFARAATIKRVIARVLTTPTTDAVICDLTRYDTSNTPLGSVFVSSGSKLTIVSGAYTDDKTSDDSELSVTNSVLAYGDYLNLDIDQVGIATPGADLSITVEAILG